MSTSVYTWGDNRRSQLGGCASDKTIFEPAHLDSLESESIVTTAGGASHTLYLSEFGDVFACGRNVEGQCGTGTREDVIKPTPVRGLLTEHRVVSVCCSALSSLAVTSSGRVYEFGLVHESDHDGENNETSGGNAGSLAGLAVEPTHNEIVARIVRRSNLRYLQDGCEEGVSLDEGVLAVKTKKVIVSTPRLVESLRNIQISSCAAGDGHMIVSSRDGTMYACGSNDRGQLGDGTRVNRAEFVRVMSIPGYEKEKFEPIEIAIGQQHNVVLMRHRETFRGVLFTFGSGALGQLGQGTNARDSLRPRPVYGLLKEEDVVSIACGSNHCAAVTREGKVFMVCFQILVFFIYFFIFYFFSFLH